jgi:hypothetical protein
VFLNLSHHPISGGLFAANDMEHPPELSIIFQETMVVLHIREKY